MIVESISIIMILLLIEFIFLRSKKPKYALIISPLLIVPFVNFILNVIPDIANIQLKDGVNIIVSLLFLVVSTLGLGFFSNKISSKKSRTGYLILCGGFSTILTIIFIFQYINI